MDAEVSFEMIERVERMVEPFPCVTYAISIQVAGAPRWFRRAILDQDEELMVGTDHCRPEVLTTMREAHWAMYQHWQEKRQG